MTGNLDDALIALLKQALPAIFGGATPAIKSSAVGGEFTLDASSADVEAGQPRSDSASEILPFDPALPAGPYQLTRHPDDSVKKVRLTTAAGDRIALQDKEVIFETLDTRRFSLALRPGRDVAAVNGVLVMYGVTAVFAQLKYVQELSLTLDATDVPSLERAEALAMAVLSLNRSALVANAARTEQAGDYGAEIVVKALHLLGGDAPTISTRRIKLRAEIELKGTRALADGEGRPIQHIRSAGSTSGRPIDIHIDAET